MNLIQINNAILKFIIRIIVLIPFIAHAQYQGTGSVTRGPATTIMSNIYTCTGGRVTSLGSITSTDKKVWTVPSKTNFDNARFPFASDLNNSCTGKNFKSELEALASLNGKDIIDIDSSGELITAFVFADNYFEMYINGVPVGKDNVPYTPFNSNIIRFKVKRPFTVAMLLVDWEENLGLGSENNSGLSYYNGDGGMVAVFKDSFGNIIGKTDSSWKAQTYYTAPVVDLSCPKESGSLRLSDQCPTKGSNDGTKYYALHWERPAEWMMPYFDDSQWPAASIYANNVVGVDNKPAYTNFTNIFDHPGQDAQFIWSTNLILDNEVLVRYKVNHLTGTSENFNNRDMQVFPNPAHNKLFLSFKSTHKLHQVRSIEVYDLFGHQVIYSSTALLEYINIESLSAGVYLIKVWTEHGSFIQKFVAE
ncbi:MAG: T9SS type A sorting domain-containing protein [Saprospiraceae bacterium]|nr:T9SS type A sorting domain-containing protein [Saprospiraceae bacterium]HMW40212.1 T9SS type A sorting domain-containing protein [Saprospiraceae bacterium]HMX89013.1 T9SS type A sorting domain-containing protein [Saprospiraceae bacterium]HMZ40091.1 T9SS type A sorting domain-containing protein [Saprospiraceae bacterium]HNA64955.1 T9SS type A sorting domain-containing protein [Saprospiraceae bacterium]